MKITSRILVSLLVVTAIPSAAKAGSIFGQSGIRVEALDSDLAAQHYDRGAGIVSSKVSQCVKFPSKSNKTVLNNEVRYFLPKQVLDLTLTFTYWADRAGGPLSGVIITKVPTANLLSVADPELGFKANYKNVRGLVTDCKNSEITIAPNHTLGGLNGEYEDQTATIAANLGQTAINIAKKIGTMGAAASPETKEITIERVIDLDAKKAELNTINAPIGFEKGVHFDLNTASSIANDSSGHPPRGSFGDQFLKIIASSENIPLWENALPKLTLWLDKPLISAKSKDLIGNGYVHGVFVRSPEVVHFILTANVPEKSMTAPIDNGRENADGAWTVVALPLQYVLLDFYSELAQTGTFSFIPVQRHMFSDVSTQIKLNAAGSCTSINETSTSPLKTLTEALKNLTGGM